MDRTEYIKHRMQMIRIAMETPGGMIELSKGEAQELLDGYEFVLGLEEPEPDGDAPELRKLL